MSFSPAELPFVTKAGCPPADGAMVFPGGKAMNALTNIVWSSALVV